MVRVLDMLCQPVLSPVNLFTANWYLEVLESNKTCNASSCDQCSYSWESHRTCPLHTQSVVLGFQLGKYFRIFRMLGYSKNILKKNSVLIINLLIVSCKGFIPNIRIWRCMFQLSSVFKISVLDMLSQPVLGNLDILDLCRGMDSVQGSHEFGVLPFVILAVVPVNVLGITELNLFMLKVHDHGVFHFANQKFIKGILFYSSKVVK